MNPVDMQALPQDVTAVEGFLQTRPSVALVLGSGLDSLIEAMDNRVDIPYSHLEGMRAPNAVAGHAGALSVGDLGGKSVICFRGRTHRYQGVSAYQAAYPSRLAAALGATTLIVTNAAGSVVPDIGAGRVMLITDHINLTGDSPLVGWPGPEGGTPFVPMGDAYDCELQSLARTAATDAGVVLAEGVYAGLLGPAFETPAEVRYLRTIGASVVGMSTVPEVIAARALGLRVLGLSLVTNAAGGSELSHSEVLEAGARAGKAMAQMIRVIVERMS